MPGQDKTRETEQERDAGYIITALRRYKNDLKDTQTALDSDDGWISWFAHKTKPERELDDVEELLEIPNRVLSKNDLLRKRDYLERQVDIFGKKVNRLKADNIITEYRDSEDELFNMINDFTAKNVDSVHAHEKERIYACADRALVVATILDGEDNNAKLIECWRMVNLARTIAYNDFKKDPNNTDFIEKKAKYLVGAREIFGQKLVKQLPAEMQLLKIFYAIGDYEAVERYLQEFNELNDAVNISDVQAKANDLMQRLATETDTANKERALQFLAKRPGFNNAPTDVKEEIIKQRAYIQRVRTLLSFDEVKADDPLRKDLYTMSSQLEQNIDAIMLRDRALYQIKEDFVRIQEEIATRETAIMNRIFAERMKEGWEFTKNTVIEQVTKAPISTVAGIGSWLYFGAPFSTTSIPSYVSAASFVGKRYKDVKDHAATLAKEKVKEMDLLSKQLDPVDFMYLRDIDKLMEQHSGIPVNAVPIESFSEHVKKQATAFINENIVDPVAADLKTKAQPYVNSANELVANAKKLVIALFALVVPSFFLSMIILTAVFPIIWPAWIIIAVGVAIGLAAWNISIPKAKIAEKIMQVCAEVTSNIATVFNILLAPFHSMRSNFSAGRILPGMGSLIAGVFTGIIAVVLVPVVTPLMLGVAIFGGMAGAYQGLSFRKTMDKLFSEPLRVKKEEDVFTHEQIAYIDSLIPAVKIGNRDYTFSQLMNEHFLGPLNKLKDKLSKSGVNYDDDSIKQFAAEVSAFEKQGEVLMSIIKLQLLVRDRSAEDKMVALDTLTDFLEHYLGSAYDTERSKFIKACEIRKSKQDIPVVIETRDRYVENIPNIRFSSQQREKIIGAPPEFRSIKLKGPNYEAERETLNQLAAIKMMMKKVRPRT